MEGSNIKLLCKYFVTVIKENLVLCLLSSWEWKYNQYTQECWGSDGCVSARREEWKGGAEGSVKEVVGTVGKGRWVKKRNFLGCLYLLLHINEIHCIAIVSIKNGNQNHGT